MQQLLQAGGTTAVQLSAVYRQVVQLAANPGATTTAAPPPSAPNAATVAARATTNTLLDAAAPAWLSALPSATAQSVAGALFCWAKLGYTKEPLLWSSTLSAFASLLSQDANAQDLSNVAYAIAAMAAANGGVVPGLSREEAEAVLRVVTHRFVSIVSEAAAAAAAAGDGAKTEGASGAAGAAGVSLSQVSTLRWAHEVFEGSAQ